MWRGTFVVCALVALRVLAAPMAQAAWTEPTPSGARLATTSPAQGSDLAVIDGVPYVSYVDGTTLQVARLRPDGSGWDQLPSPTTSAVTQTGIVGFNGRPAVLWLTSTGDVVVSQYSGTAWGAATNLRTTFGGGTNGGADPTIAVIRGNLWAAWTDNPTSANFRAAELVPGVGWTTRSLLGLSQAQRTPALADVGGTPVIALIAGGAAVQVRRYTGVSGNPWPAFGATVAPDSDPAAVVRPVLAAIGSTAYVAFNRGGAPKLYGAAVGGTWTQTASLPTYSGVGTVSLAPSAGGLVLGLTAPGAGASPEGRAVLIQPVAGTAAELVGGSRPLNVGAPGSSASSLEVADSGNGVPYVAWAEDNAVPVKYLRPEFAGQASSTTTDGATFTATVDTYGAALPFALQRGSATAPLEQPRILTTGTTSWTVTGLAPSTDVLWRPVLDRAPFVDGDAFATARTKDAPAPPPADPAPQSDPPASTTDTTPPPSSPVPDPAPAPDPTIGKTASAGVAAGKVLVTLPGTKTQPLGEDPGLLPVGTKVDTTDGKVELRFDGAKGKPDNVAIFYDGVFTIAAQDKATGLVTLKLAPLAGCARPGRTARTAAARKNKVWGDGKGKFRTRGKFGAATVRGTKWLTEDTCSATKVTVARGVVDFQDLSRGTTRPLKAGSSATARAKTP